MDNSLPINEDILDLCINAIYDEGKTIDDCLAQLPEGAAVEPLLRLAGRLQSAHSRTTAPAGFRLSARERLEERIRLAEQNLTVEPAQTNGRTSAYPQAHPQKKSFWPVSSSRRSPAAQPGAAHPVAASSPGRRSRAYAIAFALILIVLLVSTTTTVASRSLPGQPLYGVKIISEQAQLALSPSPVENASLRIKFAENRFQEIKALIQQEKTGPLQATVHSYQEEINQAAAAYQKSSFISPQDKTGLLRQLTQAMASNDQQLSALLSNLPIDHPRISSETITRIKNDTKPAAELTYKLFADLRDDIRGDQDLLKVLQSFPSLKTVIVPGAANLTSTPLPSVLQTPIPGVVTEEGGSELPTLVTTIWPTPWITDWATLIPDATITPPGWFETILPTGLFDKVPTYLPTYYPTADPGNGSGDGGGDDEFPGWEWEWPGDFPDNGNNNEGPGW